MEDKHIIKMTKQLIPTQYIPCAVCGSVNFDTIYENVPDYEYALPGYFTIVKCKNCGLLMQNPILSVDELIQCYPENYAPHNVVGNTSIRFLRKWLSEYPRVRKYKKYLKKGAKVLEVGCSTGKLLHQIRSLGDYELYGVEPVNRAAEISRNGGFDVFTGILEDAPYENNFFDIIIMNYVLEHVPNINKVVTRVYNILKPGGFFFGELPCADSIERIIFRQYWQGYQLPLHLIWFSRPLLQLFFEKHSFKIKHIKLKPQFNIWQYSLRNYLTHHGHTGKFVNLLSGHNILFQLASVPMTMLARILGFAANQSFLVVKPEKPVNI